jgi:hypothetical protein
METNPWLVNSIEAFYTHECPECDFTHKAENDFQNHAVENHPLSFAFFGKTENETDITIEENDIFDSGFKKIKVWKPQNVFSIWFNPLNNEPNHCLSIFQHIQGS